MYSTCAFIIYMIITTNYAHELGLCFLFSDIIKIKIWNECVQIIGNKYCIYMYKIFDDSNTKENVSKQAA